MSPEGELGDQRARRQGSWVPAPQLTWPWMGMSPGEDFLEEEVD